MSGSSSANKHVEAILTQSVGKVMFRMTLPMAVGIIAYVLIELVDTFFVGQLGTNELAALGFIGPVFQIAMSTSFGLAVAFSVLVARMAGQGEQAGIARLTSQGNLLMLVISLLLMALGYWGMESFFHMLGAGPEQMPLIQQYMDVWLLSVPVLMLVIANNSVVRSLGDVTMSGWVIVLVAVLNGIMDPVFIFGVGPIPALGLQGAALATLLAWLFTLVFVMLLLAKKYQVFQWRWQGMTAMIAEWRTLLQIGVPAMTANWIMPLWSIVMTALVARYGPEAVAGFSVGNRVLGAASIVLFSLGAVLPIFIGQNVGVGNKTRAYQALMGCLKFVVLFHAGVYLVIAALAPAIAGVFSDNTQVLEVIEQFIYLALAGVIVSGVPMLVSSSLNALHHPGLSLLLQVLFFLLLSMPSAFLGAHLAGIAGIFAAMTISTACSAVIAFVVMKKVCVRQELV